jgi:hypothetical protein
VVILHSLGSGTEQNARAQLMRLRSGEAVQTGGKTPRKRAYKDLLVASRQWCHVRSRGNFVLPYDAHKAVLEGMLGENMLQPSVTLQTIMTRCRRGHQTLLGGAGWFVSTALSSASRDRGCYPGVSLVGILLVRAEAGALKMAEIVIGDVRNVLL